VPGAEVRLRLRLQADPQENDATRDQGHGEQYGKDRQTSDATAVGSTFIACLREP